MPGQPRYITYALKVPQHAAWKGRKMIIIMVWQLVSMLLNRTLHIKKNTLHICLELCLHPCVEYST